MSESDNIDKILSIIPFSGKFDFTLTSTLTNKRFPFYSLPLMNLDNTIHGIFPFNDEMISCPIGFKIDGEKPELYNLSGRGLNKTNVENPNFMYLPIKNTGIQIKSQGHVKNLYGIETKIGLYPFMNLYFQPSSEALFDFSLITKQNLEDKLNDRIHFSPKLEETFLSYLDPYLNQYGAQIVAHFMQKYPGHFGDTPEIQYANRYPQKKVPTEDTKALPQGRPQTQNAQSKIEFITDEFDWRDPQTIIKYLKKSVIGQEQAIENLALGISNYMTKAVLGTSGDSDKIKQAEQIKKENLMFIGPTGVGKTFSLRKLLNKITLPYTETGVAGVTAEGYVGSSLSSLFINLKEKTGQVEKPYGIMFLDEIDKIALGDSSGSGNFPAKIQDQLIAWSEAGVIYFNDTKDRSGKEIAQTLNTQNILFITAGAFSGESEEDNLESIISKRMKGGKTLGFGAKLNEFDETAKSNLILQATPRDVMNYGFKPEFMGRYPLMALFGYLTKEEKMRILMESDDSALISYKKLFDAKGYDLKLMDEERIIELIVDSCPNEIGARGLQTACSRLFRPILLNPNSYTSNNHSIQLMPGLVEDILMPKIRK